MFDTTRLTVTVLLLAFLRIVNINPNEGNEFEGDEKVAKGGKVEKPFKKQVAFAIVESLFVFFNLYNYGALSLTFFEWLIFGLATGLFVLRLLCYYTLGKFFTYTLMVKKDHKLVETGPYKYLVHPSYTGQVGVMLCFILFTVGIYPNFMWLLTVPIVGIILATLKKRMRIEEAHMTVELGDQYTKYFEKRKRLIPFVY